MRRVEFHPDAQDEVVSAARFYERQSEGLGRDFIVGTVLNRIDDKELAMAEGYEDYSYSVTSSAE